MYFIKTASILQAQQAGRRINTGFPLFFVTQKMIFAFSLSKNANPLSHLQVQFESALATHPLCYNLISNSFESPLANLIPASHIYLFEAKCFPLQRLIVPGQLTFTNQNHKISLFLPHKILILSSTKLSATPLSYWI